MNIKVESIGNRVRITNDHEAFTPLPTDITTKSSGNFVSIRIKGDEPVEIDINVLLDKVTVGSTVYNPNTTSAADIEAAIIPLFPKANTGSGGTGTTTAASIALPTIAPVNAVLANGDTLDVAANKLQGQVSAKASNLVPTAIKTSAYTAQPNDFVLTDATAGNVPIALPTAPADKTRVGIKMIGVSGSNTTPYTTGGSDVLNKAGGSTSASLSLLNQSAILQYNSATGIWSVTSADIPLSGLDGRFALKTSIRRGYSFALGLGSDIQTGTNITNDLIIENSGTIQKAWINAKTPPTGSALIVNIKVNGTSIWATNTGNRLQLASGANIGSQTSFDTTSVTAGDLLSIDVVQVGSTTAGQYATIQLVINQ